jgi:hypothetical protein
MMRQRVHVGRKWMLQDMLDTVVETLLAGIPKVDAQPCAWLEQ